MKKLIILAAVVALSTAANAAKCKWSFAKLAYSSDESLTANYTAYLIDNTWAQYDSAAAAAQAVATSGTSANGVIQSSGLAAGTGGAAGTLKLSMTTATDLIWEPRTEEPVRNGYKAGEYFDAITIILDGKGNYVAFENDGVNFNASSIVSVTKPDLSSSTWKNVPEPTSGLLMLLGMAGLALKRKRA